ncbi:hypothetical protein [Methanopyrus sp. SNP6]|uniref:hypothetical protein n=1 Tax=Methanopyrus sp. SNP6 TaxID=1937005 RepID=UPI0011E6010D|nr:hypothetical protein [Methanopyrus sp. SNP6]
MLAAILGLLAILSPAAAAGTLDVKDVDYPSQVDVCSRLSVKFKIVDASTGQPVPDASVLIRIAGEEHKDSPPEEWTKGHYVKTTSGSDGSVTAQLTAPGKEGTFYIWVKVEKEGYEPLVKCLGELKVTGTSTCEHEGEQHQHRGEYGGNPADVPVSPLVVVGALCALVLVGATRR